MTLQKKLIIYIYTYTYMLSRQLGDHVCAFSQVNVWDAFAHRTTAIFEVHSPPVFRVFLENAKKQEAPERTTPKVNE